VGALLAQSKAFAAIVLDGLLVSGCEWPIRLDYGCSAPGTLLSQRLTYV